MKNKIKIKFLKTKKKLLDLVSGEVTCGAGLFLPEKLTFTKYPADSYPRLTQEEIKSLPF